jgi:hypothetical protein
MSDVTRTVAETGMRTTLVAIVASAAWLAPASAFAQARAEYPYCAYGGKTSEGVSCDFATLAQCQATTAGGNGSCMANPRAGQAAPRTPPPPAGRR